MCGDLVDIFTSHVYTEYPQPNRINPTREGVGICTGNNRHNSTVKVNQKRKGVLSYMRYTRAVVAVITFIYALPVRPNKYLL